MTALWTEVCLAFPALDALREGYEVFPVVDAVGGTSPEAHRAGWSASSRPAHSPSGGYPWPASCNVIGPGPTPSPLWSTSCSLLGSAKGSEPVRFDLRVLEVGRDLGQGFRTPSTAAASMQSKKRRRTLAR